MTSTQWENSLPYLFIALQQYRPVYDLSTSSTSRMDSLWLGRGLGLLSDAALNHKYSGFGTPVASHLSSKRSPTVMGQD